MNDGMAGKSFYKEGLMLVFNEIGVMYGQMRLEVDYL